MSSDPSEHCLSRAELEDLIAGRLDSSELAKLEHHLDGCGDCRDRIDAIVETEFKVRFESSPGDSLSRDSKELSSLIDELTREPSQMDLTASLSELHGYQVIEEVARGGMGIVLKAYDPELQRTVAIKLLAPALAGQPAARERFLREARASARLQHENVMPIHAVDQTGSLPYIVTPFVEGEDLQQRLEHTGSLPIDEVLRIGLGVTCALEEAHSQGIVHRDVKPANIMLLAEGERVWLCDFGLALVANQPGLTQPNMIAGTPQFMAPEQVRGERADHRTDLFALGAVIYAMLSGRSPTPFEGESSVAVIRNVEQASPRPVSESRVDVPEWLSTLVGRLLSKDPEERPQTATEVRASLESSKFEEPKTRPTIGIRYLALAVVAALAIGLVLWFQNGQDPAEGFYLSTTDGTPFSTLTEAVDASSDGDTIILNLSGKLEVGSVRLGKKKLTLRAGVSCEPVLLSKSARDTILSSEASVCLEGITFSHPFADANDASRAVPIVRIRNGSAFVANCRFLRATGEKLQMRFESPPLVSLIDCDSMEMVNSTFYTMVGTGLLIESTMRNAKDGSLRLENNLLVGQLGVKLKDGASRTHRWRLERNTIAGSALLSVWADNDRFPPLHFDLRNNAFDFKRYFLWLRDGDRDSFHLSGGGNLFHPTQKGPRDTPYYISRVQQPARMIGEPGSNASFEAFSSSTSLVGTEREQPILNWDEIQTYKGSIDLVKEEMFRLIDAPTRVGVDVETVGPGEPYDRWSDSEEGIAWRARVSEMINQ